MKKNVGWIHSILVLNLTSALLVFFLNFSIQSTISRKWEIRSSFVSFHLSRIKEYLYFQPTQSTQTSPKKSFLYFTVLWWCPRTNFINMLLLWKVAIHKHVTNLACNFFFCLETVSWLWHSGANSSWYLQFKNPSINLLQLLFMVSFYLRNRILLCNVYTFSILFQYI